MAKRNKTVVIDGYASTLDEKATIADVTPAEANHVITSKGAVIPRARFADAPLPEAFDVYLSQINKGGG